MSKTIVRPTLSLGNHIYLYRLLRDAIGCGKQTFMTQVEEALAAGDMTAYDLGFESTRELLEELNDCIKLTVFKGGRLYATVIANEDLIVGGPMLINIFTSTISSQTLVHLLYSIFVSKPQIDTCGLLVVLIRPCT